ncbi:MAG: diguanylate cyclase [Mycetocola sp.]
MTDQPADVSLNGLTDLFANAPCGFLVTSADGVVTLVNDTYLGITGHDRHDVIGQPFKDLLTVGSGLFHETRHMPVLQLEGRADEVALSFTRADGGAVPTLVNSVMAEGPDGHQEIRIAIFNSTRRRDYERDLLAARRSAELSETRVRILQQASSDFVAAETEQALLDALAESLNHAIGATATAVLRVEPHGGLELVSGSNPLQDLLPADALRPESEAQRRGQVVVVTDTTDTTDALDAEFPDLPRALRSARLESLSAVPVLINNRVLGVVVYYFGRLRHLDDSDLDLSSALTRQASQTLARIRLQDTLTQLALHDQLTGLSNRKLLEERLDQALATARRNARPISVIFLDLDGFKAINDTSGHSAGDAVLQRVAEKLSASVRHGDTIGRYGGDEFVVLCDDADADAATRVAERIQVAIREPLPEARGLPLSVSVGIAVIGPDTGAHVPSDAILRAADVAMYASKNAGKDRVTVVHV